MPDNTIPTESILVQDRVRQDLGDIDQLCNSIRENGLIQPIVIERKSIRLVAGGRRLAALKRLSVSELIHGKHFIWRDEETETQHRAAELEENLRRKALSWQEEVEGKAKLLELLQSIHGVAAVGAPRADEKTKTYGSGIGVGKLAAVLGESVATTSRDLTVAANMKLMPSLAKCDTKGAALQRLKLLSTVITTAIAAKQAPQVEQNWTLYEGDFRQTTRNFPREYADLVLTDLPYGTGMSRVASSGTAFNYDDPARHASLIDDAALEASCALRQDRYALFWFGFTDYAQLYAALTMCGLDVIPQPIIWVKNNIVVAQTYGSFGGQYEACLVARKGSPTLMRPNASNVKHFNSVPPAGRRHANEKPVDLLLDLIKDTTAPGSTVVDLMAGSGSTGEAALRYDCKTILFEKEPLLCQMIRDRLTAMKK